MSKAQRLAERMADAVRAKWPDLKGFRVVDVVESATGGHEVLLRFGHGGEQWEYLSRAEG